MKSLNIILFISCLNLFGANCNYYVQKNAATDVPTTNKAVKLATKKMKKMGYTRVSEKLDADYILATVYYRSTDMPYINTGLVGVMLVEFEEEERATVLVNDLYELSGPKIKKRTMKKNFKKSLELIPECF